MPFMDLPNLRVRYELTGSAGPVLVFSNSLGTNHTMWNPQMPELSKHFRILRYDTRGHGESSVTPGDYTIEQLGRDVIALLDALGMHRVHFCGLSMGGSIGMWLGVHAPERLDHLVLCNTAAKIGTPEVWSARIATVRSEGMKPVAAAVIERWFTPEFRTNHPEQVAWTRHMLENSPPDGYASNCAAVRDADLRSVLPRITAPVLIIYGAKDPVIPLAIVQYLASQIPGSKTVELDASHLSNVEQADAFTQALLTFLSN